MKLSIDRKLSRAQVGYSLIEVLVAASILIVGVGAAAKLSLIMVTQEEINQRVSVSLSHQEMAVRLYQLGLSQAEVEGLLPHDPNVASITYTTGTETISGAAMAPLEYLESTMTVNSTPTGAKVAGEWNGGGDTAAAETRINVVRGYRYSNRFR